jgi:hypothetical protein
MEEKNTSTKAMALQRKSRKQEQDLQGCEIEIVNRGAFKPSFVLRKTGYFYNPYFFLTQNLKGVIYQL